ncbi:MAG: PadR family transcriptional regulator [Verrucomicrobiota bacterium]
MSESVAPFKWVTQLKRGILELCCLNLLASERLYGYELAKRLSEAPAFDVSLGTVYPLLSRLKKEGLVDSDLEESPLGPARRKYRLSNVGAAQLIAMNAEWRTISNFIETLIAKNPPGEDPA